MNQVSESTRVAVDQRFSRRHFMVYEMAMAGIPIMAAIEAVASTALDHPEWDMGEEMTWAEWTAEQK